MPVWRRSSVLFVFLVGLPRPPEWRVRASRPRLSFSYRVSLIPRVCVAVMRGKGFFGGSAQEA